VTLAHVVAECSHLLQIRAKNRSLTIHQVFEDDMPRLWADERAARQICLNLLSNAIKFTPPGGEIWLKVGWTASGGQYLSVRDSGPGIPEEEIPIVLASFGQGSNSIKSAEQGAGLGLPIAKSLIDLHNGTFTLKSKLRDLPAGTGDGGARPLGRAGAAVGAEAAIGEDSRVARAQISRAQMGDVQDRGLIACSGFFGFCSSPSPGS
jgi:signal transduction histidine kinase